MDHFTDESEKLINVKRILLANSGIGFGIFLVLYFLAWFYPLVSTNFNGFVIFHIMHFQLILATCIVRGSLVKPEWMALYMGSYFLCGILDLVGFVFRTIFFVIWHDSASAANYTICVVLLVLEGLLIVVCVIQIIICREVAHMGSLHMSAQDLILGTLMKYNHLPNADERISKALKELDIQLGLSQSSSSASSRQRRQSTRYTQQDDDDV